MDKKNLVLFLHKNGKKVKDISEQLNITPNYIYKILSENGIVGYRDDAKNAVYHTEQYKEFRKKVMDRDGNKCVKCKKTGSKFNRLQVDHKLAKSTNKALIFDMSNAQTLCRSCHAKQPTTKTYKKLNKKH